MSDAARVLLDDVLTRDDPRPGLWDFVRSGTADTAMPELPALQLEQDPIHRHKDVLAHSIAVTAKTPPRLLIRMAALLHDIGKPKTRRIHPREGVTFRFHEVVGARMARVRLKALGYDEQFIADASRLVELSGRFKGYSDGWSDSAVRRYARDAGPLLGELNQLVRCDQTTRDPRKIVRLNDWMDDLERRTRELAAEDARDRERPDLDGEEIMAHLGIGPGREVGMAWKHLLSLKRERGEPLGEDAARAALDDWWSAQQQD